MTAPQPGTSTSFRVDMERAPQAIRDLRQAQDELTQIRREAVLLGRVTPSGRDQVSADAATVLSTTAEGGPGSLVQALDLGIEQVKTLANSLEDELAAYRRADETALSTFSRWTRA